MATNGTKVTMTSSHPGDFIRTEIMEGLGLTVTNVAEVLGVRRPTLSDLLNGKAALSPEMALRIEKAFGVSMDMLLRMRASYDASQMRARASETTHRPALRARLHDNHFPARTVGTSTHRGDCPLFSLVSLLNSDELHH